MKHRHFILMYISDANHPIKRVTGPKSLLYLLPITSAIIMLSAVLWITHLKLEDLRHIEALTEQLKIEAAAAETIIEEKNMSIELLQQHIVQLSSETTKVKQQIEEIEQLKENIMDLSSHVFPNNPLLSARQKDTTQLDAPSELSILSSSLAQGGVYEPVTDQQIEQLAFKTEFQLNQLEGHLVLLSEQLSEVITALEEARYVQSITPSIWPSHSRSITSGFGYRTDPFTSRIAFHNGIDFSGDSNDPIYAAASGVVAQSGWDDQYGYHVILDHARGLRTVYMHLNEHLVSKGDQVKKGDWIGKMGSTGRSTGTHLHYEIHRYGSPVNPSNYLP